MPDKAPWSRVVTEFVLRIPEPWAGRIADVVTMLTVAGAEVTRIAGDRHAVAGVVETSRVGYLSRLPCVQDIIEGATYLVGAGSRGAPGTGVIRQHRSNGAGSMAAGNSSLIRGSGSSGHAGTRAHTLRRPGPRWRTVDLLDVPLEDVLPEEDWSGDDWQDDVQAAGDLSGTARSVRWAVCGYGVVAVLAGGLMVYTALQKHAGMHTGPLVQACSNALLLSLAIVASLGLWRYRLIRHACTAVGLLVSVLPGVIWGEGSMVQAAVGLAAFLIAGTTADSLSRLP